MKTTKIEMYATSDFIESLKTDSFSDTSSKKEKIWNRKITIEFEEDEHVYKLTIDEISKLALDWMIECGVPAQADIFIANKLEKMGKVGEIKK